MPKVATTCRSACCAADRSRNRTMATNTINTVQIRFFISFLDAGSISCSEKCLCSKQDGRADEPGEDRDNKSSDQVSCNMHHVPAARSSEEFRRGVDVIRCSNHRESQCECNQEVSQRVLNQKKPEQLPVTAEAGRSDR